jgi:hypothetical protein
MRIPKVAVYPEAEVGALGLLMSWRLVRDLSL